MSNTEAGTLPNNLGLKELGELLVRHYGLTEGMYDVALEYQIGLGAFGPAPDKIGPGLAISVTSIGLSRSPQPGPFTVDASTLAGPGRKRASTSK